jgi:hypothetical protein
MPNFAAIEISERTWSTCLRSVPDFKREWRLLPKNPQKVEGVPLVTHRVDKNNDNSFLDQQSVQHEISPRGMSGQLHQRCVHLDQTGSPQTSQSDYIPEQKMSEFMPKSSLSSLPNSHAGPSELCSHTSHTYLTLISVVPGILHKTCILN